MTHLSSPQATDQELMNTEKCQNCPQIFIVDSAPHHEGIVATHSDQTYCTMECLDLDQSKVL